MSERRASRPACVRGRGAARGRRGTRRGAGSAGGGGAGRRSGAEGGAGCRGLRAAKLSWAIERRVGIERERRKAEQECSLQGCVTRAGAMGGGAVGGGPGRAFGGEVDGLQALDRRALEEDLAAALGAGAALEDAQLQALLDAKVPQRGERHGAQGVDAQAGVVVCDAAEGDGHRMLGERGQAEQGFQKPSDSPRLAAVVLDAGRSHDHARPVAQFRSGVVDFDCAAVGYFLEKSQKGCLEIFEPRFNCASSYINDSYRLLA